MRLRTLLLAGTVAPFALVGVASAAESGIEQRDPLVLAQASETQVCPPGTDCPNQPAEEAPPEQPPAAEAPPPPPPAEEPPAGAEAPPPPPPAEEPPAAAEAPPPPPPAEEPPAAAEAPPPPPPAEEPPAAAEVPPPPPPAEEPPAAAEAPPPPPAEEPPAAAEAPPPPAEEAPAAAEAPPPPAEDPPAAAEAPPPPPAEEPPAAAEAPPPPAAEEPPAAAEAPPPPPEDTTVEEQLEAQGDREEAENVRTLREQLLEQLMQAVVPPADEPRDRDRDRDRRGRDRYYDRDDDRGEIVEERGGRIIIDLGGGNIYVEEEVPDEGGRLLYGAENVEVQELPHGRTRTIVYRPNGVEIITVRDRYGDIIRRVKRLPDGREIVLIDNRFPEDDPDYRPPIFVDIPPPVINIPRERYIVDLGHASQDDIYYALQAPPVQEIERPYTLDEVLRNEQIRAYQPRIDLDTITFETGSATIGVDQMQTLFELGQAMEQIIAENPDEVYLIEGHTDLVGSNYANLILSDRRAEAVAVALSQNFDIPPENLVTEGYGEQYPKIPTEAAERRNRRATVVRLTDLMAAN